MGKTKTPHYNRRVQIYFSPKERAELYQLANTLNIKLSELCREAIRERVARLRQALRPEGSAAAD